MARGVFRRRNRIPQWLVLRRRRSVASASPNAKWADATATWAATTTAWDGTPVTATRTGQLQVRVSGTFVHKPTLVRVGGTFTAKPVEVRVGGAFQNVT